MWVLQLKQHDIFPDDSRYKYQIGMYFSYKVRFQPIRFVTKAENACKFNTKEEAVQCARRRLISFIGEEIWEPIELTTAK